MRHIGTHVGHERTAPSATSKEEILADLVGFDTVSDRSNRELIDYVVSRLSAAGVPHILSRDVGTDKVALLATIGPMRDGGILLSGHTDVVPVADQAWTGDPFILRRDGDRLTGRGSTDMRGFCAAVLGAVPALVAADLERPIHILLSYDEETTGGRLHAGWILRSCDARQVPSGNGTSRSGDATERLHQVEAVRSAAAF